MVDTKIEHSPSPSSPVITPFHYETTGRDALVASLPFEEGSTTREYVTFGAQTPPTEPNLNGVPRPPFKKFIPDKIRVSPLDGDTVTVEVDGVQSIALSAVVSPYAEAMSGVTVKCVDLLIIDLEKGEILLGDRDQEPQPATWVIGGRKRAGETDIEAAQRNASRELNIRPKPSNLIPLGMNYDMVWDTREQGPLTNESGEVVSGSHQVSTPFILPVKKESLDAEHNEEYTGLHWVSMDEILESPVGTYHPALVDMVRDAYERLTRPDELDPSDHDELAFRALMTAAYHQARIE